jgi:hypothetical protein
MKQDTGRYRRKTEDQDDEKNPLSAARTARSAFRRNPEREGDYGMKRAGMQESRKCRGGRPTRDVKRAGDTAPYHRGTMPRVT